jgi:hypothetical protein
MAKHRAEGYDDTEYPAEGYEKNLGLTKALDAEVDRQRDFTARIRNGQAMRAALLMVVGIILLGANSARGVNIFHIISLLAAICTIALGAWALLPRYGFEVNIKGIEDANWDKSEGEALWNLKNHKLDILKSDQNAVAATALYVRLGVGSLILSVITLVIAIFIR